MIRKRDANKPDNHGRMYSWSNLQLWSSMRQVSVMRERPKGEDEHDDSRQRGDIIGALAIAANSGTMRFDMPSHL